MNSVKKKILVIQLRHLNLQKTTKTKQEQKCYPAKSLKFGGFYFLHVNIFKCSLTCSTCLKLLWINNLLFLFSRIKV